ncbi:ABC transporter ATP-binding protein [Devosia sp. CAU 1758]
MALILQLSGISRHFGEGTKRVDILDNINLDVEHGEFVAILGFSGAGKTTLISLMAGLSEPDRGGVIFRGREIDGPGPERGVVFQSYSLMPWLSVAGNVDLAIDAVHKRKSRAERLELRQRYVEMVGLGHALDRRPAELSGGMRQRVAVARALAMQPEVLLLDEPLSALDALTRSKLQDELALISEAEKKTIILITNDVDEAILLADRVIPLTPGPAATLGPAFTIGIERPRDRTALNGDDRFITLRRQITEYLMDVGAARNQSGDSEMTLPNVVPIARGRSARPPKAYAEAAGAAGSQSYLTFSDVSKVYPTAKGPLTVVDRFDFQMKKGEFVTLIGHSGCGKSTVLSMVAGLNDISSGSITLDGNPVVGAGPERAVVFQAPSLMPWLTARENVALGVDRVYPKASAAERRDVVEYYLNRVGLGDSMHRPASELSNGMKQRVGIARAFALSPKLLLLDEPFGMLDSITRWELQDVLMDVWARTQVTAICVTHDVDEAILLADRVVMTSNGPNARIGNVMEVDLPRPRSRKALLAHKDYYAYREELHDFLEAYEGGADPDQATLDHIRSKRAGRSQPVAAAE